MIALVCYWGGGREEEGDEGLFGRHRPSMDGSAGGGGAGGLFEESPSVHDGNGIGNNREGQEKTDVLLSFLTS